MLFEPTLERLTYAECPNCKEQFVIHDELCGENPDIQYAWWDACHNFPVCSESCLEKLEEDFGWEYEEELKREEIENLKREARRHES